MKKINCEKCGILLKKDEIALNKKLISKHTKEFFCLGCMAKQLETSVDFLNDKIEQFKEEGCTLFL